MSEIDTINLPEPFIDVYRWTFDHYQSFPDRFTLQLRQSAVFRKSKMAPGKFQAWPPSYKTNLKTIKEAFICQIILNNNR